MALRAEDGRPPEIKGDPALLDLHMPVVSLRSGDSIRFDDAPEDWARSLPLAYRAGDLIAAVIHDDDPIDPDNVGRGAGAHHGAAAV